MRFISVVVFVLNVLFAWAGPGRNLSVNGRAAQPNIPGSLQLDFGFNQAIGEPTGFDQGFWGSRTVNLYYQYRFRIGTSKFSVVPNLGLGLERFKFVEEENTLAYLPDGSVPPQITLQLTPANTVVTADRIKKSMLIANYIDLPLELRFDTNPDDIPRSFNIALGGRVGYLFESMTKIVYTASGQVMKLKDKQDWELTKFRYGVHARIGVGSINLFFMYNLSPTFEEGKGPLATTMNSFTTGISLNGF
jgi:hypothetical protein